jgi:Fe/S biogenesis protein NfuA
MGGGCQGCSSAALTLQSGIAERMKEAVPEVKQIIDTTDHAAGTNPYFKG